MAKIDTLFMTKVAEFGAAHTYYSPYKGVPPPPPPLGKGTNYGSLNTARYWSVLLALRFRRFKTFL